MRTIHSLLTAVFALMLAACASVQSGPTQEQKQALAPTGKLRVGFLSTSPIHATKDPATGEFKGPAVDLGREMARRIGVQFEPVAYTSFAPVLASAQSGEWDIAMMGVTREREQIVDFTAPYMVVQFGYLVPSGSSIATLADVDKPGVRIAVLEKSSPDGYLSRTVQRATLIRFPTIADMANALKAGQADALYGTTAGMLSQAEKVAGSRVLEDRLGGEEAAVAVPRQRQLSAAYARQLIEQLKSEGVVKAAIERAGLRGVVVASPK